MSITLKYITICITASAFLTACGNSDVLELPDAASTTGNTSAKPESKKNNEDHIADRGTLTDLLANQSTEEIGAVNKYLWQASLDVLSFLPINSADPFTGLIVFGKGRAPKSSQTYSASVFISDPALDARALRVVVRASGGLASAETQREIENAILSRARELRIAQAKL